MTKDPPRYTIRTPTFVLPRVARGRKEDGAIQSRSAIVPCVLVLQCGHEERKREL